MLRVDFILHSFKLVQESDETWSGARQGGVAEVRSDSLRE